MTKTVETTVLKPHMTPSGHIVQVGEKVVIDETRYRALVKKGYVAREGADTADEDEDAESSTAREGITNRDFKPRRKAIVKQSGDGE